ncbi:MAG: serine/threonine protein kinase, partial [Planctomycetota bacterium]
MSDPTELNESAQRIFQDWLDKFRGGGPIDVEAMLAPHSEPLRAEALALIESYERLRRTLGVGQLASKEGRTLGDFRLLRELGHGGVGVVWEAEQITLKRRVALKLLSPMASLSERNLLRFRREAEAGARLTHPGIVPVLVVGEHEGTHYMAQELIPGGHTLADQIADLHNKRELPSDYYEGLVKLFAKASAALAHAHQQGVIHRDVKPSNILMNEAGDPVIADFGLARVEGAMELSRTGDVMGTPYYMSPEQVDAGEFGVDHRSDIFSIGVTLYECLTLSRPFDGDTSQQVYEKIKRHEPPDPRLLRSRVPRDLAIICMKAMEKIREHRYLNMAAFSDDLTRILNNEPIVARSASPWARAVKWTRRHPIISTSGGIAAVAIVVITLLIFQYREQRDRSRQSEKLAWEQNYLANISPAALTLEGGSFRIADKMLAACPEHLRGWEWNHMRQWLSRSLLSIEAGDFSIAGLAYDPDGKWLVGSDFAKSLRVWNAANGERVSRLKLWSPLRVNGSPEAGVWRSDSGTPTILQKRPLPQTYALRFSPDGSRLYAGSTEYGAGTTRGLVHVWSVPGFEPLMSWTAQERSVDALAILSDGTRIATGGGDGFRVFDAANGAALLINDQYSGDITSLAFDPAGQHLITGAKDGSVRLWSMADASLVHTWDDPQGIVTAVATTHDGERVLAGSALGHVHQWDLHSFETLAGYDQHDGEITSILIMPSDTRAISSSKDGAVYAWDLTGTASAKSPVTQDPSDTSISQSNDSDLLWRAPSAVALAIDTANSRVALGSLDGGIRVLDLLPDEPVTNCPKTPGKIRCVAWSPDGNQAATGTSTGHIWIWDTRVAQIVRVINTKQAAVNRLRFVGSDSRLLALCSSGVMLIFDGGSTPSIRIETADRSTDGAPLTVHESLIASGVDDKITVWDSDTGSELQHFEVSGDDITAV